MARMFGSSPKDQAELLKDQGNSYFKKEKLGAAIEAYTQAITLCPKVPAYWTNRALCHKKRNEWHRVESDCLEALELDNSLTKAHYMLGLALLERQQYHEATKHLEKALDLGRGATGASYMVEEIWQELAKARYVEWVAEASKRQREQRELKDYLFGLLKRDYENKIKESKLGGATEHAQPAYREDLNDVIDLTNDEVAMSALENAYFPAMELRSKTEERRKAEVSRLTEEFQKRVRTMEEVFDKAGAPDRPGEVPDYLCCQISMDIFRDPVITPSGVTYERAVLMEHLRKVGKFDPLTRATLHPEQVAPNLAIKEAVQTFLSQNGWAYKT